MGLFNLRWNNHVSNVLQMFIEHFSSEAFVDVTLSCEGRFIKAHKIILSACSPYFQELFLNHDSKHPMIILNGIKFVDLQSIVEFMYNGEIKVEENDLGDLLAVAETLQIKGLCNIRERNESTNSNNNNSHSSNLESELEEKKIEPIVISSNLRNVKKRRKTSNSVKELADERFTPSQKKICLEEMIPESSNIDDTTNALYQNDIEEIVETKKIVDKKTRKQRTTIKLGLNTVEKIPRPPNAFMVFANEWRRKLAFKYPGDSNTEISVRLGVMWKGLDDTEKNSYYALAKKANEEHKIKYPGYFYSPKEARMRKHMKQDLMLARCVPPLTKDVDALRYVKVFMNGNDGKKNSEPIENLDVIGKNLNAKNPSEHCNKIVSNDQDNSLTLVTT